MAEELVLMTIGDAPAVLVEAGTEIGMPVGIEPASIDDVVQNAAAGFDAAIDAISASAARVVDAMRRAGEPDEVTLQFGIKITVEAGAIIAKTGGEANFSVTLKWTADKK
jgi:hypothetical protein